MVGLRQIGHRTVSEVPAILDPDVRADVAFRDAHQGLSREEWLERERFWAESDALDAILAPVEGEPPAGICKTSGMLEHRARLANYLAWLHSIESELATLEAERDRLNGMVLAPEQTQSRIADLITRGARALLGRASVDCHVVERSRLEADLSAQKHRADAARIAAAELDEQIAVKRKQLARLNERRDSFLHPAVWEHAEDKLRADYVAAVRQLRGVMQELFAARSASGREVPRDTIRLPDWWPEEVRHDIPPGGNVKVELKPWDARVSLRYSDDFMIKPSKERAVAWRDWAARLLVEPETKAVP